MEIIKIDEYIKSLDLKDITKKGYRQILVSFNKYLNDENILQPNRGVIVDYKRYLSESKHSSATIKLTVTVLKGYYRWVKASEYGEDITYGVKSTKVTTTFSRQALSIRDCQRLLDRAKKYTNTLVGLRNYAIIALLLTTGIRTIELERCDIEDIDIINNEYVLYIQGKGRDSKDTFVKLPEFTYKLIHAYLEMREPKMKTRFVDATPLFLDSANKRRLTKAMARVMIKDLLMEIGLESRAYSAHSLRHSFATNQLELGASVLDVKELMRHSNIAVTQVYVHVHNKMKENLNEKLANKLFEEKELNKK